MFFEIVLNIKEFKEPKGIRKCPFGSVCVCVDEGWWEECSGLGGTVCDVGDVGVCGGGGGGSGVGRVKEAT